MQSFHFIRNWFVKGVFVCLGRVYSVLTILQSNWLKAWFLPSLLTAQVERASPPGGVSPSVWVWESHCSSMRSPYFWRAPETWVYWTESWWSAPGQPASPLDIEREKMWSFKKSDIISVMCVIEWKSPTVCPSPLINPGCFVSLTPEQHVSGVQVKKNRKGEIEETQIKQQGRRNGQWKYGSLLKRASCCETDRTAMTRSVNRKSTAPPATTLLTLDSEVNLLHVMVLRDTKQYKQKCQCIIQVLMFWKMAIN